MSNDLKGSYLTHSNYIRAFGKLVFDPIAIRRRNMYFYLYDRIHNSNVLPAPNRNRLDLNQVRSSLHVAWGTETLLLMSKLVIEEEELLRLSNNWSSIQTYYVLYHCTQALYVAKGQTRPLSHPRTQNIFFDLWGGRPIFLEPWSLTYGVDGVGNAPLDLEVDVSVQPWTACEGENLWNLAAKALMTTRRHSLHEKLYEHRKRKKRQSRKSWLEEENARVCAGKHVRKEPTFRLPRLNQEEKNQVENKLRPFTIMDYLYRLRIKTNYEDSNMFTDGPDDEVSSISVRNALCTIAGGALFLHELSIRSLVGKSKFIRWAQNWTKKNLPTDAGGLAKRLDYF